MNGNPKDYFISKYEICEQEHAELLAFVELVANGKRSDGTYNYCREALEHKAKELLENFEKKNSPEEPKPIIWYKKCENCRKLVDIETEKGHEDGCDYVWGRRGWRQKGQYDG